jgi:Cu(I)/Ag(I) efflux system membrane fusion protein
MKLNPALAIGLLGLAFATPAALAEPPKSDTAAAAPAADPALDAYPALGNALYKDDLEGAKKAAAAMAKLHPDTAMAKHCHAIADSKTLEEARLHFKECSDLAIAKKPKSMHEMHCPMAFAGKGANWLQDSADEVKNPYMGAKMPHCGKLVK